MKQILIQLAGLMDYHNEQLFSSENWSKKMVKFCAIHVVLGLEWGILLYE